MTFDDLRSLAAGFQPSKLLLVALDLGLFDLLARGPRTATEIGAELGVEARATGIAANALVALGLLRAEDGRYRNAEPAAGMLVRTSPGYKGEILRHLHATWEDWNALADTWRTGRAATIGEDRPVPPSEERVRNFILGMENLTRELAPRLADLLPLAGCRKALDLGGGPGNYSLAFARREPGLRVVHFDLPSASPIAREFLAGKEGADRVSFVEGDFLVDALGQGYDFVWVSQILHMLGRTEATGLVERIAGALANGGVVAVHDHILEPDKTSPRSAALFGVHMLVATAGGRTYSFEEMESWLRKAGLTPVDHIDYGGPHRILLGRKEKP